MKSPSSASTLLAVLSGSMFVNAVCTGDDLAIGPPDTLTTGYTQYDVYDTSCNRVQSLEIETSTGPCDSEYFLCSSGTINGYDDPTTGDAYICEADTTSEACGMDTISFCCYPGYSSPE
ncbi:hypothetical protein VP1G_00632 [Cytospora mali]|uniref:Uncharacterized protein n=1 Tax=Cytospora mali TaxID=578113 RepID=A0A194UNL1_CYTMA|nr:hypothetical protein VP1G_00632 [Valsa mali var. pyri (nom. inval.)]